MAVPRLVAGAAPAYADGFVVAFLDGGGVEQRVSLAAAVEVALEAAPPVRSFPSYRGQRNFPGLWWSATMAEHVGYESWLERDHAMLLDFDPQVVGFAAQPFWLLWHAHGKSRAHAPDFFARLGDGTGIVVDCRPANRIKPRDAEAFAATERACDEAGWRYRLAHAPNPRRLANVRWLAGYRHPRHHHDRIAARLLGVIAARMALLAAAEAVGDPIRVLPVAYHLLWRQVLLVDLDQPLGPDSPVWPAEG